MPEDETLTIGEVVNLLRDEFPDVSISKIRFLESNGLLAPGRSDGGYRQFDQHDLGRLRFILRQQRDHFLPLKVIKSRLTLWERGEDAGDGADSPANRELLSPRSATVSASDAIRRSGISAALFGELVSHGIIAPLEVGGDAFDASVVAVASEAKGLLGRGLEARHLRAVKHAAERESDVLGQLVGAQLRSGSEETRESAKKLLNTTSDSIMALHRLMFMGELKKLLED